VIVDCDLAGISGLLSRNFNETIVVVLVENAPDGGHASEHFVAHLDKNRRFGLKVANTGMVRAKLAYELAVLLDAPNAAKSATDPVCGLRRPPQLVGRPVLKTEWLSGETSTFRDPRTIESTTTNRPQFFRQYGEWSAAALFLGIGDRENPGNWAWDRSGLRLQLIDFESSFGTCPPTQLARFVLRDDIHLADRAEWKRDPTNYPPEFRSAFLAMRKKIHDRFGVITEKVRESSQTDVLPGLEGKNGRSDDETFAELTLAATGP
jgi:hypothetical protein